MTSDDTDAKTEALLEKNGYFGMRKEQVTLVKQEKASAAQPRFSRDSPGNLSPPLFLP